MIDSQKYLAKEIAKTIDNKKGEDIKILDVRKFTTVADYFVIATGNSSKHTTALADEVDKTMAKRNVFLNHKEGHNIGKWILLDYNDVIVHIFTRDERDFYDLERIWKGANYIEIDIDMN